MGLILMLRLVLDLRTLVWVVLRFDLIDLFCVLAQALFIWQVGFLPARWSSVLIVNCARKLKHSCAMVLWLPLSVVR